MFQCLKTSVLLSLLLGSFVPAFASVANATLITQTFDFEADMGSGPTDPVVGSATLTLDPMGPAVFEQLVDAIMLTIGSKTYLPSEVGFNYDSTSESLQIGGLIKGVAAFGPINNGFTATDDFRVQFNRVTGAISDRLEFFRYNVIEDRQNLRNSVRGSVRISTVATVPEPGTLALFSSALVGVGLCGLMGRRRKAALLSGC